MGADKIDINLIKPVDDVKSKAGPVILIDS